MGTMKKKKLGSAVSNVNASPEEETTWNDVIDLATSIDGVIRNVATGTLEIKEDAVVMGKLGEAGSSIISALVVAIIPAKKQLQDIASSIPNDINLVVSEEKYPLYHKIYSDLIEVDSNVSESILQRFSQLTELILNVKETACE